MTTSDPTAAPDSAILYRRAFEEFGTAALWSSKPVEDPTPADALAITPSLRVEGNLQARLLAEQIEHAAERRGHLHVRRWLPVFVGFVLIALTPCMLLGKGCPEP